MPEVDNLTPTVNGTNRGSRHGVGPPFVVRFGSKTDSRDSPSSATPDMDSPATATRVAAISDCEKDDAGIERDGDLTHRGPGMEPTVEHATRPGAEMSTRPFRILALDGGGIMGAFTASVLATIEAATGQRTWEHFDLITGTSTGGLIALALGMGNDAARICQMYSEHGHLIFPRDRFWWDGILRQLRGPKFSTAPLRGAIGELLQDATLDAAKVCLAIPVYDANKGQVVVFKTAHDGRYHWYKDIPAVELLRKSRVRLCRSAHTTLFPR